MFFNTEAAVGRKVVAGIRPLLNLIEASQGIPRALWSDQYLVGFLCGEAIALITLGWKGKYRGDAMGRIMLRIFTDLADDTGQAAASVAKWSLAKEPDFSEGVEKGMLCIKISYGIDCSSDPVARNAIEAAERVWRGILSSPADENIFGSAQSHAVSLIQEEYFVRRVEQLRKSS